MLRLGGLAGRVGTSVLGSRVLDVGRPAAEVRRRRLDNLTRNAARVVETLGELKGAAMKIGQMLSLHEGMVSPEVAAVLRQLQSEAPRVPFEAMLETVRAGIPDADAVFAEIEPESFAAASIGQVHRARLRDGREVAVKIQYPDIERIVSSDLANLRRVLQGLFALVSEADFDPVWEEVRERLLEELDYEHEADNVRRMAALHGDLPEIVIPEVVDEASCRTVLTMHLVEGLRGDEACDPARPQELRDLWGRRLFELQFRGLLVHRLLHADPNLANFAFREDGRLVVYDFGCLKRVPEPLAAGYARLVRAAIEGRPQDVPTALDVMGVRDEAGGPVGRDLTDPYFEIFGRMFRAEPPYRFGTDDRVYDRLLELGLDNWSQQLDIRFPRDIVFVQRTLSGHFGNLSRLRAAGPWRELALRYLESAPG